MSWSDLAQVRACLEAGADPDALLFGQRPLDLAVEMGTPDVVAEMAGHVRDVDSEHEGRTALWGAVFNGHFDNARALVAAGADPWRPMMSGWSPGRLSLAGPDADLFAPARAELSADEVAAVAEAARLIGILGVTERWDLNPGGEVGVDDTAEEVLLAYLYPYEAVAYSFAYAGLRPTDARAITGPVDLWLELPDRDYWRTSTDSNDA